MYYKKITKIIQKDFFGIGFFIKFGTDKDIKLKERSPLTDTTETTTYSGFLLSVGVNAHIPYKGCGLSR